MDVQQELRRKAAEKRDAAINRARAGYPDTIGRSPAAAVTMRGMSGVLTVLEEIALSLEMVLACQCDSCGHEFDLPSWEEPPWNWRLEEWALQMAPAIKALGWTLGKNSSTLLCPGCSEKLS